MHLPAGKPSAVIYAADGREVVRWAAELEAAGAPPTVVVGVHGHPAEDRRLEEYSLGFDEERFDAHERFFTRDVPRWVGEWFGIDLPPERTAVFGASAGGELAIALGLRHPDLYGTILCGSPGAGYRPPENLPALLPRAYFVAGDGEPFFLKNAARWAQALRAAGGVVEFARRDGGHGSALWRTEFPAMVRWAFDRAGSPSR